MQVFALKSFVACYGGQTLTVHAEQVLEMPEGADWVRAGLVVPVVAVEVETATLTTDGTEQAVAPPQRRKGKAGNAA